jgi:hypothetical protein
MDKIWENSPLHGEYSGRILILYSEIPPHLAQFVKLIKKSSKQAF